MKSVVLYDSQFGNTKTISDSIAKELGSKAIHIDKAKNKDIETADLVVVGSPIQAWNPTAKMKKYLSSLPKELISGKKVATFDTRVAMLISGTASDKMAKSLVKRGGRLIIDPEKFIVGGKEGPLVKGEIEKAKKWAKKVKKNYISNTIIPPNVPKESLFGTLLGLAIALYINNNIYKWGWPFIDTNSWLVFLPIANTIVPVKSFVEYFIGRVPWIFTRILIVLKDVLSLLSLYYFIKIAPINFEMVGWAGVNTLVYLALKISLIVVALVALVNIVKPFTKLKYLCE